MQKPKAIIKRPWYHQAIIWGYILAPVVNVLLVSLFINVPVSRVLDRLFQGFGPLAAVWLLTAPLVGIGLYFVHRFSWYLFLAHSSLILVDFIVKWVAKPLLLLETIPALNNLLILLGNLTLVVFIGYIIQRDFRSPYFQVLPRSWRSHARILVRHRLLVNKVSAMLEDISVGGCYVPFPDKAEGELELSVGDRPQLEIRSHSLNFATAGEVMRKTPGGYGIRFLGIGRKARRNIRHMVQARYGLRYVVEIPAEWRHGDDRRTGVLYDISGTGCFLATDIGGVQNGAPGRISLTLGADSVDTGVRVMWINGSGETDRPQGFGMQFSRRQKKLLRRVEESVGPLDPAR